MEIAITADVHLRTRNETPERFNALENIFDKTKQRGISNLFIAGDLMDKEFDNYNDFDSLCKEYPDVHVTIIPGNHDPQIEKKFFTATNIEIIRQPLIKKIDELSFLFIPYDSTKSIDEALTEFIRSNKESLEKWILIGHGDYITGNRELNPYERGFYMPISSKTINKHNPWRVILGHIHKPSEFGKVIYPGSPCGIDRSETGKRRFIIYDTQTHEVKTIPVQTDIIYFINSIIIFPDENEIELLRNRITQMIKDWKLSEEEHKKVKLELIIRGWTNNKEQLKNSIIELLQEQGISLQDPRSPDLSEVKVSGNIERERISILKEVEQRIDGLSLQNFRTSKDKILEKVMELILKE